MTSGHTSEQKHQADDRIKPSYLNGFLERVEPLADANRMRFDRIQNLEDRIDKLFEEAEEIGFKATNRAVTKGVPLDSVRKNFREFIRLQTTATELSAKKLQLAEDALLEVDEVVREFDGRLAEFEAQLRREGRVPKHHAAARRTSPGIGDDAIGLHSDAIGDLLSEPQGKPPSIVQHRLLAKTLNQPTAKSPRHSAAAIVVAAKPTEGEPSARAADLRPGSSIANMRRMPTASAASALAASGMGAGPSNANVRRGMQSVEGSPSGIHTGAPVDGVTLTRRSYNMRRRNARVGTGEGGSGAPVRSGGLPPRAPPRAKGLKAPKASNVAARMFNSGGGNESSNGDKPDVVMEPATGDGDSSNMNVDVESEKGIHCYCRSVSHGKMIACEGKHCSYEWFHFGCVGLKAAPSGSWLCPACREKTRRKTGRGRRKRH